ncbi:hypothetical protein BH10PAT3_BH10PAT3_5040 [soil metagenome]
MEAEDRTVDVLWDTLKEWTGGIRPECAAQIGARIRSHHMAGTKTGGKAAASTNKSKYGSDFYAKIGAIGGKKGHTGGFAANRDLARIAGAKGGRVSRRTKKSV